MKKLLSGILIVCMLFALTACDNDSSFTSDDSDSSLATGDNGSSLAAGDNDSAKKKYALVTMKDYGHFVVELDFSQAPITCENFVSLVEKKFYDGLTIHRLYQGLIIQGGDPKGDGTGGPGYKIKGEFLANGVENNISHTRGTISMARAMDYNSAGSQFFIMLKDYKGWDGSYAAFGHVISGMEVVDKIGETPYDEYTGVPEKTITIESIVMIDNPDEYK